MEVSLLCRKYRLRFLEKYDVMSYWNMVFVVSVEFSPQRGRAARNHTIGTRHALNSQVQKRFFAENVLMRAVLLVKSIDQL